MMDERGVRAQMPIVLVMLLMEMMMMMMMIIRVMRMVEMLSLRRVVVCGRVYRLLLLMMMLVSCRIGVVAL